jgi:hypothetical protein
LGRGDAVTEEEWLASSDPRAMLDHVWRCGRSSDRVRRLLAVACCRRVWHLFTDERCCRAIEVAERFADGQAEVEELRDADEGTRGATCDSAVVMVAYRVARPAAAHGPRDAIGLLPQAASSTVPGPAPNRRQVAERVGQAEHAGQADLLRCLFGPWPFRPPALDPFVLAWNGGVVRSLAQAAYNERQLPSGHLDPDRLLILADALEEAGADAEVLAHLRGPGPHVRGCWAVDLVLGLS